MVTVIDSIMGSGKSTWAIEELLNSNLENSILYVTPFLNEIDRVQKAAKNRRILAPKNKGEGKIGDIKKLLQGGEDIATTHELFKRFDDECKQALKQNEYILILDEAMDAVSEFSLGTERDNFEYLVENGDIAVDDDGVIRWTGKDLDTRYSDVRILAENRCLFMVNKTMFVWNFPAEIFTLFKAVYVMTYLFGGSLMKPYFELNGIEYETKSISQTNGEYQMTDYYQPDLEPYRKRIEIYTGQLNDNVSQKRTMLSATWSRTRAQSKKLHPDLKQIKNNMCNYRRHLTGAGSDSIMWTAYESAREKLKGEGYTNGFVACNERATNRYRDRTTLMYVVNRFVKPGIVQFFEQHGITVDEDAYALSEMLQWIWRSNIRVPDSDKKINIYIPSGRMRELLSAWLYG